MVQAIVRGCAQGGTVVSDVLAAFVARTIVESNGSRFSLDAKTTTDGIEEVILQSIEKLLERDNPALETIKMQVDYDTSYLNDDTTANKNIRLRNKLVASNKLAIVDVIMEDSSDFEALTLLYRRIFRFLLEFAPNSKSNDRTVEREVAAALESVFPRIGLKAFVLLSREDKSTQLMELARIVLGIRLFNKDQGRGGTGLDDMDVDSVKLANAMASDLDREVEFFGDACSKYQLAIQRSKLLLRRKEMGINDSNLPEVNSYIVDRWTKELINRRQYLSFIRTIQDDIHFRKEKIVQLSESLSADLKNLKSLISNKASIAKEIVYPRFDAIGGCWIQLFEEATMLTARANTFSSLCKYRLSFNPTVAEEFYDINSSFEIQMELLGNDSFAEAKDADVLKEPVVEEVEFDDSRPNTRGMLTSALDIAVATSKANLLSVQNTPDFNQLPLELQGFCPWTLIHAKGLLVPGKPALGVIRFENMYFVCDHELGITSFLKDPDYYLDSIKDMALRSPEFIHLLHLQRWFPNAAIARLLNVNSDDATLLQQTGGKPTMKDAATSTPTHFVETHIDINYHWNEWELRRRALKIVNLKGCVTTGQQTDKSHYRRDCESQVFLPKEHGTQTKRDKGVNPPITTTYIAGLRGGYKSDMSADAKDTGKPVSKYGKSTKDEVNDSDSKGRPKARILSLSLDL